MYTIRFLLTKWKICAVISDYKYKQCHLVSVLKSNFSVCNFDQCLSYVLCFCLSSYCVLCTQCYQCLMWIVHSWLPLRFSLTFICSKGAKVRRQHTLYFYFVSNIFCLMGDLNSNGFCFCFIIRNILQEKRKQAFRVFTFHCK